MTPETPEKKFDLFDQLRAMKWVWVALLFAVIAAIGVAVFLSSKPAFFARYRGLARSYDTLQTSVHKDIACGECHAGQRGPLAYELALTGDFYRSLFVRQNQPTFTKMDRPSRDACLACHREDWSVDASRTMVVPHPAHLKVSTETRDCVTCHKWTAHEEAYTEKHKSMPFSGVCATYECHVGWKPVQQCSQCHHTLLNDKSGWKKDHPEVVRSIGTNACLEKCHEADQCRMCHTTGKTPVFTGLLAQTGLKAIEVLHVKPDWIEQHGTQALADQSKCLVCHVSEGECQDCHARRPAFHGSTSTWLGTHKEFAKDKRRCLTCHQEPWCKECHDQFKEMR